MYTYIMYGDSDNDESGTIRMLCSVGVCVCVRVHFLIRLKNLNAPHYEWCCENRIFYIKF